MRLCLLRPCLYPHLFVAIAYRREFAAAKQRVGFAHRVQRAENPARQPAGADPNFSSNQLVVWVVKADYSSQGSKHGLCLAIGRLRELHLL